MFKRKLFKRALPIILSVAMVFQSAPTTAYAAEGTTEPETVIEQSTDEVVDDGTGDNGAGSEEADAGQNEGGTEESKSPETQTTEETKPAETQTAEENKEAEETQTEETKAAEAETEEAVEEAADNTAQSLVTEISVTANNTSATYAEGSTDPFASPLETIKNNTVVKVNGEDKTSLLKDKLTYKWQSLGTDDTYADMAEGKVPVNAGNYRLVISLPATEGACEAAEKTVDFEIKKAEITVTGISFNNVTPGTTVKEFIDAAKEDYTLKLASDPTELNKATYVKNIEVAVKDALTGAAAEESAVFANTSDYVATVTITLNDSFAPNYAVPGYEADDLTEQKITVADLIETEIQVINKLEDAEKVISKIYDGKEADVKTLVEPNITVTVITPGVEDETTKKPAVIAEATYESLEKVWVDANDIELKDEEGKAFAPVDAGTYYYVLKYAGKEGVYAEAEAKVKVVIEPAKLIIKPVVDEKMAFYTTMSEQDVLDTIDYKLYELDETGAVKTEEFKIDRDTFWGVSYMDKNRNQAYEPVFKLQYAVKDKDGNLEKDKDGNVVYRDNNGAKLEGPSKKEYRVVFTGKKAVYTAYGTTADTRDVNAGDVNSAEPNYNIKVDAKTIADNSAVITIADAKTTTIDVSAILKDGKGADYASPIESIYNGSAIYDERATYKKAVVKAEGADVAKNQDLDITYEWYELTSEGVDEDGKPVPHWTRIHEANVYAPTNAGTYRLLIDYEDPDQVYAPSQAEVFYKINPQFLSVVPSGNYRVYSGTYTYDFIDKIEDDIAYKIYSLKENKYNPKENGAEYTLRSADRLRWFIERENVDDAGNGTGVYEEYDGEFVEGYNYRLAVELTPYSNNYANRTTEKQADNTEKIVYFNDTLNVAVDPMGETEVEITVDPTKLATTYKQYDGVAIDTSVAGFVTVTKKADGSVVTDIPAEELVYAWELQVNDGQDTWTDYDQSEVKNAGVYSLTVSFAGNDKYKTTEQDASNIITITKRPLTITPTICGTVVAGTKVEETLVNDFALYDPTNVKVEGYAPADEDAFTYGLYEYVSDGRTCTAEGYAAWADGSWQELYADIYEKDATSELGDSVRYRGNTTYEVEHYAYMAYPYDINYAVTYERAEFTPVRGNAVVEDVWNDGYGNFATSLRDTIDGSKHTIIPVEGVQYVHDDDNFTDSEGHQLTGNYFVFKIVAPKEFNVDYYPNYSHYENSFDSFVFKNSIKAAGGHILATSSRDGYIYVAFDADKDKNKEAKSFDIRWEEGYTETFTVDLTKAILEVDLTKAVAPKSLAFNGVDTKMAVGETQQLDVKVTKEQISDIICLGYKVDDPTVLSVTDSGYVTALSTKGAKSATATVTVYPARIVDGDKVAIAGAKTATVKITVSDVVTPVIKKTTAKDTSVAVEYAEPVNGYRREFYVLEGKNIKADEFEKKIASIKNGAWEDAGFAIAPSYSEGTYSSKTKTRTRTLYNLNPSTDYTVYVRNVSGVRTLDDGTQVAVSAVGAVKSFATTKSMVTALDVATLKYASGAVISNNTVKLSAKTVQVTTKGEFTQYYEKDTADVNNVTDTVWYELPLTKDQQNNYVNPKLNYVITSDYYHQPNDYSSAERAKKDGATIIIGNRYYYPTKIATIAKNGKITLKGVGTVYIWAYDSDTGIWSDGERLDIIATADSVKAKNAKTKVGTPIRLSDYLEYKEGNAKLTGAVNYNLFIEELDKVNNDKFSVTDIGGDYVLVAKKPGTIEIPVTDLNVEKAGGNGKATIKVTAATLDPVKNLKAVNVVDKYADITFTYTQDADYSQYYAGDVVAFNIDLKDNRGSVIRNEQLFVNPGFFSDDEHFVDFDNKSNTYTFKYRIYDLTRLSNYKVTVTAIFGDPNAPDCVSKPTNVSIKTTDIPASYNDLGKYGYNGMNISVYTVDGSEYDLDEYPYFTSGNTYTLEAYNAGGVASARQTDTLTWKSTNTKVATVKANAGTYAATLKAVKSGVTTIEVTSKITKKVIARYAVYVKAVGEAGDFFGDYDIERINWDPSYAKGVEVLTAANPVKINQESRAYKWVSFTAPEFGIYGFNLDTSENWYTDNIDTITDAKGNILSEGVGSRTTRLLAKGEKVYLKIFGSFRLSVSSAAIKTLTTATPVSANSEDVAMLMTFRAPKDNYYTFSSDNQSVFGMYAFGEDGRKTLQTTDGKSYSLALNAGEEIFIIVASGNYAVSVKSRGNDVLTTTATPVTVNKGEEKWFVFTAPETGDYTFKSEGATAAVKADYYTSIQAQTASETFVPGADSKDFASTKTLTKDSTIAIRVYTDEETATANISVAPKANEQLDLNTPKMVNVKKGETQWFTFPVTADGLYSFDISGASTIRYYKNGITENISSRNAELEAGDVVYICVTAPSGNTGLVGAGEAADTVAITIKVTKLEASLITAGTPATMTLSDNSEHWFVFTAPEYGRYTFSTAVTANAEGESHSISSVGRYNKVCGNLTSSFGTSAEKVLKAGEEVVLKVTANTVATTGVTTSASITVEKVNFEAFTSEASLALGKDAVKWYSFTAPKDATYTFKKDVTAGSVDIYVADSIANNFAAVSFDSIGYTLTAGKTKYFKVVQTSGDTASEGKITVSVPTATEFTETATATLTKDASQWFKFTAPKTARYTVAASVVEENTDVVVELYDSLEGSDLLIYEEGNFFNAGKTVYFKLTTTADTATTTLSVKPIVAAELTAGTPADVTVKAGTDKWYKFTAPANGRYEMSFTLKEGSSGIQTDVYTDNAQTNNYGFPNKEHLKSGDTYYIRVYTSETTDQSGQLEVKAIPVAGTLSLAEQTNVALAKDETKWYTFTAPETGIYYFSTDAAADSTVSAEAYLNTNEQPFEDSISFGQPLNKDEIVSIAFSATKEASFNVKVAKATSIKAGETSVTLKKGDEKYFSFKPYSAGRFAIKSAGLPTGAKIAIDGNEPSTDGFFESVYLDPEYDDPYVFCVETDSETDITFNIVIERLLPTENELTIDTPVAFNFGKNEEQYVTFTAPENGRYTIQSDNDKVTVTFAECDEEGYVGDSYTLPKMVPLYKDTTKLYKVTYTSTEAAAEVAFNLSVSKLEPTPITNNALEVELAAGESKWYAYTATQDGTYTFTQTESSAAIQCYANIADTDSASFTSSYDKMILKGDTVYLQITNDTESTATVKLNVSVEAFKELAVGTNDITFTKAGDQWMTFKAEKAGFYTFSSSENLYYYGGNPDGSTVSTSNVLIGKNETVFMKVSGSVGDTATVSVTLNKEISMTVLSLGIPVETSVGTNEDSWFEFTAPSDGTYRFYSTDYTGDPYVYVYRNGKQIGYNDDGGERWNFSYQIDNLNKGETIYLKTCGRSGVASSYTVHAERVN